MPANTAPASLMFSVVPATSSPKNTPISDIGRDIKGALRLEGAFFTGRETAQSHVSSLRSGEVARRVFSAVTEGFFPHHRRRWDFKSPPPRFARSPSPLRREETV
mgnify:CR=1 FL=1